MLNGFLNNRQVIPGRLVFGGGYPLFRWAPRVVGWGDNLSLFWLGVELVWLKRR